MTPALRAALESADRELRDGDPAAARAILDACAGRDPEVAQSPEWRLLAALACLQLRDLAASRAHATVAQSLRPDWPEPHHVLGLVAADENRLDDAVGAFETTLRLRPDHARARVNLAVIQRRRGQFAAAAALLREALRREPRLSSAWMALAETMQTAGDDEAALEAWRAWLASVPDSAAARSTYGWALARAHRWADAESELAVAAGMRDADAQVESRLAFVRRERGDIDGARAAYRAASLRSPADLTARFGAALALPQVYAGTGDVLRWREQFAAGLDELEADLPRLLGRASEVWRLDWSNFYLAYQGGNDTAFQRRYAGLVGALAGAAADAPGPAPSRHDRPGRRMRIGFASSFFRDTTVGAYFGPWITELDRERFEVVLFHLSDAFDARTAELRARADAFIRPAGDTRAIAEAIRAARLDVLIYPQLGMDGRDATLASLRLAPVQCAAWGHPVTTGSAAIDVYFSCGAMEPADAADHYVERLALLPGLGTRYAMPATAVATRAEFGLPASRRLYACPQSLFKIHPDNDAVLAGILDRDPDASLVFFAAAAEPSTQRFRSRLNAALAQRALDENRAIWRPLLPGASFRALLSVCDVMVDTLHWSGGNTSLDALAAGLPIVTCEGAFLRGRQSAAMLRILGLEALIAPAPDRLAALAVELARDPGAARARILAHRGALFDRAEPIDALAAHLERLCAR